MSVLGRSFTILVCLGAAAHADVALAQSARGSLSAAQGASTGADLFDRGQSVAVRDRPHPEYEALGLPFGAFTVFPRLEVGGEYTDNVFATEVGEVDDMLLRVRPEISLVSNWSRHALDLSAESEIRRYDEYGSEDSEDWTLAANGRLDVTRAAAIDGGVTYSQLTDARTSSNTPIFAAEPIEYDATTAFLATTRVMGRTQLGLRADYASYDFKDGETAGGLVIDQDTRDRDVYSLSARGDYAVSPDTALFVQVTGNERDYDLASFPGNPARDSSGYEILVGANFELGAVARGDVAVGYISQDFDDASYETIDGFGARAVVEWFPTQLTTVTFSGSRTIEDSGIVGSGGYLSSAVGAQIDHELRRNVILGAGFSVSNDDYEGIDREDDRFNASVTATYLINRRLGVSLQASHLDQSSDGANAGPDYKVNRLMASLVTQF